MNYEYIANIFLKISWIIVFLQIPFSLVVIWIEYLNPNLVYWFKQPIGIGFVIACTMLLISLAFMTISLVIQYLKNEDD